MTRLAEALRRAEAMPERPDAPGVPDEPPPASTAVVRSGDEALLAAPPMPADAAGLAAFNGFHPSAIGKLIVTPDVPTSTIEQYRKLAAALHHVQIARGSNVVMLTSAVPGEGKTLTATNLALTLSHSYRRRVLLIDADLRRPSLHQIFQVPNVTGLNDGLKSTADQKLSLIQISDYLTLLPAGRPDPDPMSGLTSERMRRIVRDAAERFDWVVLDTPPVGLLPDANLLAGMVDLALFVIRAGRSPFKLVQRALDAVGRDRLAGVVLNAVEEISNADNYSYYGYGQPQQRRHTVIRTEGHA